MRLPQLQDCVGKVWKYLQTLPIPLLFRWITQQVEGWLVIMQAHQ